MRVQGVSFGNLLVMRIVAGDNKAGPGTGGHDCEAHPLVCCLETQVTASW